MTNKVRNGCVRALLGSVAVMALLLGANSCATPRVIRTGQVFKPGQFGLGAAIGGSFGKEWTYFSDAFPGICNISATGQVGVLPRFELLADLAVFRQQATVRFDVTNAGRGEGVSTALGLGAAYLLERGGEFSASLDFSAPLGRFFEPLINLAYISGTQWHNVDKTGPQLNPDDPTFDLINRYETRLQAIIGFALNFTDGEAGGSIMFGAGPYWILTTDRGPQPENGKVDGVVFSLTVGGRSVETQHDPRQEDPPAVDPKPKKKKKKKKRVE